MFQDNVVVWVFLPLKLGSTRPKKKHLLIKNEGSEQVKNLKMCLIKIRIFTGKAEGL